MQEIKSIIRDSGSSIFDTNSNILNAQDIDNAVLKRLILEVQVEHSENQLNAYNRTHNRHNRGR